VLFLPVESCGLEVDTFSEAVQDMCFSGRDVDRSTGSSPQQLQLIRQCTAAAINLAATDYFDGDCGSTVPYMGDGNILDRIEYCCEELCTAGEAGRVISNSGCIEDLDAFNNYWDEFDPLDNTELCPNEMLGTEEPCAADSEQCSDATGDGYVNPRSIFTSSLSGLRSLFFQR
jgi:hypothetical protein